MTSRLAVKPPEASAGVSRREFLAAAALQAGNRKTSMVPPPYIDAHVHVWTPDTQRWPRAARFRDEKADPPSFTPDELFAHAKPLGVTRVVLIQMSFYQYDNAYMLDAIARHPGVFSGVGIVDHSSPQVADDMRKLKAQGVRGFRIAPAGEPRAWLDSPGMASMWKTGAEEGLAMCPLIDPNALPSVDRMCRRFPETTVVIDHLCRIGASGHIADSDVQALCDLAKHKQVHVKVSAFYALGKKQYPYTDLGPMIQRIFQAYGPERLMWATDCPFQVQHGHTYAGSLELVRDRLEFLNSGDREWLMRKTAESVFFGKR